MFKKAIYEQIFDDNCILRVPCKVDTINKTIIAVYNVEYETKANCISRSIIMDDDKYPVRKNKSKKGFLYNPAPARMALAEHDSEHIETAFICQQWGKNTLSIPCYVNHKHNAVTIPEAPVYAVPQNRSLVQEYIRFKDGSINDAI